MRLQALLALSLLPLGAPLAAQLPRGALRGTGVGVTLGALTSGSESLVTLTTHVTSFPRGPVGADLAFGVIPEGFAVGLLPLTVDLGPAWRVETRGSTILLRAGVGGVVLAGPSVWVAPGVYGGASLLLHGSGPVAVRLDVAGRAWAMIDGPVFPGLSAGIGLARLPVTP